MQSEVCAAGIWLVSRQAAADPIEPEGDATDCPNACRLFATGEIRRPGPAALDFGNPANDAR